MKRRGRQRRGGKEGREGERKERDRQRQRVYRFDFNIAKQFVHVWHLKLNVIFPFFSVKINQPTKQTNKKINENDQNHNRGCQFEIKSYRFCWFTHWGAGRKSPLGEHFTLKGSLCITTCPLTIMVKHAKGEFMLPRCPLDHPSISNPPVADFHISSSSSSPCLCLSLFLSQSLFLSLLFSLKKRKQAVCIGKC